MRIAIGFFGITRSLPWTIDSLRENIISPLNELGEVETFASLVRQLKVINPRSDENQDVDPDDYRLLGCDRVVLHEPGFCIEQIEIDKLLRYGDSWGDDGKSLFNLVHQLATLNALHEIIRPFEPDLIIFVRPDLFYHDSFLEQCKKLVLSREELIVVPDWQWARGINDRFAICSPEAAEIYANRFKYMQSFVNEKRKPLNSEEFLWWCLSRSRISIRTAHLRASRIRSNGYTLLENFRPISRAKRLRRGLMNHWYRNLARLVD